MNDKIGADSTVQTNGPSTISIINDAGTRLVLSRRPVMRQPADIGGLERRGLRERQKYGGIFKRLGCLGS